MKHEVFRVFHIFTLDFIDFLDEGELQSASNFRVTIRVCFWYITAQTLS